MLTRDRRAEEFEAIALVHLNDLYRTALRMTRDREHAEDVVQDAFLQAWKSFHRFTPGTNARAWLFRILFHVMQHYRRKAFTDRTVALDPDQMEQGAASDTAFPDHFTDREIEAAFDRVPADFRAAVLLADVHEFAYREIAEILQVPIGTVMSRLSRGRHILRARLSEVAHSYGIGLIRSEGHSA